MDSPGISGFKFDFSGKSSSATEKYWRKTGMFAFIYIEKTIFERIGPHPRIIGYHGVNEHGELLLQKLPNGQSDVHTRLFSPDPGDDHKTPFQTRILWAAEIAEGMAHLHKHNIVWNHCHLGNVLFAEDDHIVISNFIHAYIDPNPLTNFLTGPPPPYLNPSRYTSRKGERSTDIFAYGVTLFALMSNKLPHVEGTSFFKKHEELEFESLSATIFPWFARIVDKCYKIEYSSAQDIVKDIEEARRCWSEAFEKGDIQDPDLLQVTEPISSSASKVPALTEVGDNELHGKAAETSTPPKLFPAAGTHFIDGTIVGEGS
ncbi:kinase-like protein [Rickenella mellea]|uniref:Kinase-like protein n=1 Tax=Rickenella mellea TaxID=50990 RepID=A0A4Y7QK60_9AGAM|nr:kinase-like protein [Rickenella mellea]